MILIPKVFRNFAGKNWHTWRSAISRCLAASNMHISRSACRQKVTSLCQLSGSVNCEGHVLDMRAWFNALGIRIPEILTERNRSDYYHFRRTGRGGGGGEIIPIAVLQNEKINLKYFGLFVNFSGFQRYIHHIHLRYFSFRI